MNFILIIEVNLSVFNIKQPQLSQENVNDSYRANMYVCVCVCVCVCVFDSVIVCGLVCFSKCVCALKLALAYVYICVLIYEIVT